MTERNRQSISPDQTAPSSSAAAVESSTTKQRRKRKWDQPDESLLPEAVSVPGFLPLTMGGITLPGAASGSATLLANILTANNANALSIIQTPTIQNEAAAMIQKQTQSKIQDELIIAREIVINDAETAIRYKLTKRQTQEEIQKTTGAVVITRGKYRPPNSVPDGEKPLYLHISAGVQLKETAERIIAVDRAAAIVEEMLKHGQNIPIPSSINSASGGVKVSQPLSTCVYLGFDADPSIDIVARIRGPNMKKGAEGTRRELEWTSLTKEIFGVNRSEQSDLGATVLLRGHGSGTHESMLAEGQQPLNLFLSCNNLKGLEDARLLANNLLDTISRECGSTRVLSGAAYAAVPPPPSLLDGVHSSRIEPQANLSVSPNPGSSVPAPISSSKISASGSGTVFPYGQLPQLVPLLNAGHLQPNGIPYAQPPLTSGTSYDGYGGIYPQATPLQQVALALRRSNSAVPAEAPAMSAADLQKTAISSSEKKGTSQKRKFRESPAALQGAAVSPQGSEAIYLGTPSADIDTGHVSVLPPLKFTCPASTAMPPPPPKKSATPSSAAMPPPPPKSVPTVPPPSSRSLTESVLALKSCSSPLVHKESGTVSVPSKLKQENVPDTLIKLMEYGEDDEEDEDNDNDESDPRTYSKISSKAAVSKPFWAI
ncbi:RIK-like protein [Drosera capensis]